MVQAAKKCVWNSAKIYKFLSWRRLSVGKETSFEPTMFVFQANSMTGRGSLSNKNGTTGVLIRPLLQQRESAVLQSPRWCWKESSLSTGKTKTTKQETKSLKLISKTKTLPKTRFFCTIQPQTWVKQHQRWVKHRCFSIFSVRCEHQAIRSECPFTLHTLQHTISPGKQKPKHGNNTKHTNLKKAKGRTGGRNVIWCTFWKKKKREIWVRRTKSVIGKCTEKKHI